MISTEIFRNFAFIVSCLCAFLWFSFTIICLRLSLVIGLKLKVEFVVWKLLIVFILECSLKYLII